MITVGDLLKTKGGENWSILPQASAFEALEIMAARNVGALLVVDNGRLVGIFSERDYARKVILKGKSSKETPVSELMTKAVLYVTPKNTLEECMALMTSKHIRHLPVLDHERIAGIVTLGDVVKRIISDQRLTISELENYLTESYGS